ncbi:TonB-dependent receptor plug domain-containing protein [Opitutus terrae]|uniref:TonB-dependent receptor plug n=1 Tax=Opitutus terrae (strain DSM 11246 / JCM 15787 / PB90-1) TaxID=452637 RepID=B1ZVV2_OPITP|nr:TonB-dependent receptor plug domain-containing protein [Opitutus terrae]ACB75038.1 TonB-dependent receptor plug [Opitutus terrae PB90-1]
MNKPRFTRYVLASALTLALSSARIVAQTATPSDPTVNSEDDQPIVLSPFVVDASEDRGSYQATSTLAGSRVKTDLKDVASSISVITADFLKDTGARNSQDLLVYTTNTEVGGVYGNYGGVGNTFIDGANENANLVRPSNNNRVRGLDSADNTRDFFQTDIPWDSYNVGRVDLQRGPNSILFGIGSPAGIINSSLNLATFGKNGGSVENRISSFGSVRNSIDYNYVVLKDELALRLALLDDHTKYRQRPAFNRDQRAYLSGRWAPKFLNTGSSRTSVRFNYENGDIKANRPRALPPWDSITPYFDSTAINKKVYDPYYAWESQAIGYPSSEPQNAMEPKNYWVVQYMVPGTQATANPMFFYDMANSTTHAYVTQAGPTTYYGLSSNGDRDAGIDGFPYGSNIGIASFNEAAYNSWRTLGQAATPYPAADKGFYKRKSLVDESIFNFYDNLIDGPNKGEWQKWDAFNIAVEQTFLDNRLGFELVYDYQDYRDGSYRTIGNPTITVDIRANLMNYPWTYPELGVVKNPNVNRAMVGGSGRGGGNAFFSTRDDIRFTGFGEFRFKDVLGNSLLSTILGTHRLTGLYSRDTVQQENRTWTLWKVEQKWSDVLGNGTVNGGSGIGGLVNGDVVPDVVTYISGDLSPRSSAAGLNLPRLATVQEPTAGGYVIPYFDSHWNATNVNPADPWTNPARQFWPGGNQVGFQSDNPANYVGWVQDKFNLLNWRSGDDINQLYTDVSKVRKVTDSQAFTWQGFLFEDTVVGTFGWRRDEQDLESGDSSASDVGGSGYAHTDPAFEKGPDRSAGESKSWGVVVHTPKRFRTLLPGNSYLSFSYSDGTNMRVENRYGFSGNALPNARGKTKDFGVALSTLNERLVLKATWYKTTVKDANLSTVTTETTTLGNNTYYLRNLEAWGTTSALIDLAGRQGGAPGWEWYWNWALIDNGWDGIYNDPNGDAFRDSPSTAKQTAAINSWLSQMPDQSWFDAYGFPIDVAAAKAGNWQNAIRGWTPSAGVGGVQPSGGGRINGVYPTGTADNESKGVEFELIGQVTKGLNISINASKQNASQTALGQDLVTFIEATHAKYESPAGDLRLWWGGDATLREYFNNNIWSAYLFQLETNGRMVAEMSPWRFNSTANYSFDKDSRFRGVNVGLSYRWQDKRILGYRLNADKSNLDINSPIWSETEDYIDMWVGYERKLTPKIGWRVQLNLRNVGDDARLLPLSVQPDGSPAMFKIQEGMTWSLTNTFTF